MIIEIDGIKYQKTNSSYRPSKAMSTILMTGLILGGGTHGLPSLYKEEEKPMSELEMIEEYKLILQKKSNLTSRKRDGISWWFERNFTAIKNEDTKQI